MRKIALAMLLGLILSLFLCSCDDNVTSGQGYILLDDLKGAKIGIVEGITDEALVENGIPDAKLKSFATVEEGAEALRNKKIAALALNPRNAEKYLKNDPDLVVMLEKLVDKEYMVGTFVHDTKDGDKFLMEIDATTSRLRHTGDYDKLYEKYFETEEIPEVADFEYYEGVVKDRVLTVGVAEDNVPFSYKDKNGKYIGFDVEFANEVAKTWGAKLEIKGYRRGKLLNATKNGEVKMVMGRFTKLDDTDPRDWMLFSQSYYDATQILIINRENAVENIK